ncbi:hypothetical protein J4418_03655 [Candidatus Woesearchaeota archaeon]|nr:hypothetical protein [Candidatus Woesearchaeota archaeon]
MYKIIILSISSVILLFLLTAVLIKIYRPGMATSAISVKSRENKCVVRVEKIRR